MTQTEFDAINLIDLDITSSMDAHICENNASTHRWQFAKQLHTDINVRIWDPYRIGWMCFACKSVAWSSGFDEYPTHCARNCNEILMRTALK